MNCSGIKDPPAFPLRRTVWVNATRARACTPQALTKEMVMEAIQSWQSLSVATCNEWMDDGWVLGGASKFYLDLPVWVPNGS